MLAFFYYPTVNLLDILNFDYTFYKIPEFLILIFNPHFFLFNENSNNST